MELEKETIAGIRRFLNTKQGKSFRDFIDSKRPTAFKQDLDEVYKAAMCAAETRGYEGCQFWIDEFKNNTKLGENNNAR